MTNTKKCMLCRTSDVDILNLGEMKTCENVCAHYYCLLLASTIKQSGEDDEGILGFLPSDILDEMKRSKTRRCDYCQKHGATILCSARLCKVMFHLPCGLKNQTTHRYYGRFPSLCRKHRQKQAYKKPTEPQICSICYETINFRRVYQVLWAPCCKKQSFFHKPCIQQMALSAGYFFKCPICNNSDVFQKAMKQNGVFIPDRDASWELEPNAFEELLYRHGECNAQTCLCKSGRQYNSLGPWTIILCIMCGSQGTHIQCSNLKKNEDWSCTACVVSNQSSNATAQEINSLEIIPIQPSTSNMVSIEAQPNSTPNDNDINDQSMAKKRKRSDSTFIEIDSEDSDVVIIEEEPISKCLITQDRSRLRARSTNTEKKTIDTENHDSSSCSDFMNLVITDVRSLSETNEEFIESKTPGPSKSYHVSGDEFKNVQNKIMLSATVTEQLLQPEYHRRQQQFMLLQNGFKNNNSVYQQSNNQHLPSSNSSDDLVIID